MVADAISRLRTFVLYQDNNNEEGQLSFKDAIENSVEPTPNTPAYTKIDKVNLNLLRKEQLHDRLCKKKVKEIKTKPDPSFILDKSSILRKAVKLKYTAEPAFVVPRKVTNIIIYGFHDGKGNQGIS